ncbi:MAG: alkaline shock response membrane anchor protein AmaP [Tepidanaerobacteraceae bacterium]|nr:alkaline shock response membrane anchor protein AmaP [Tepidanaerobacteraceae bacterium]
MNLLDRIMLTIYALFLTVVSVIIILFATGIISLQFFSTSILMSYGRWETGVVGVVLLLLSLRFLLSGLKTRQLPDTTIANGELGKVSITLNAVESLVLKVVRGIENIKDSKIKIKKLDNGVSILLKLTVNFDVIIPETSFELQKTIKDYIENTAGITVKDVRVSIDNVSNQPKQKAVK